jgi:hypothetical protein
MAREDITVVYTGDDASVKAHISLERDDARLDEANMKQEVGEDVDYIELKADDVEPDKFTKLLEDNARRG